MSEFHKREVKLVFSAISSRIDVSVEEIELTASHTVMSILGDVIATDTANRIREARYDMPTKKHQEGRAHALSRGSTIDLNAEETLCHAVPAVTAHNEEEFDEALMTALPLELLLFQRLLASDLPTALERATNYHVQLLGLVLLRRCPHECSERSESLGSLSVRKRWCSPSLCILFGRRVGPFKCWDRHRVVSSNGC